MRVLFSLPVLLLGWAPAPACAQGAVDHVLMEVSLPDRPEPIPVRITLTLEGGPSVAETVPMTLLIPPPVQISVTGATSADGEALPPPEFSEVRPHYRTAELPFDSSVQLEYSVEGGWSRDGRVTLPIPAPGWVPASPHPRTFVARVAVPSGWTVLESFPTSVTLRPVGGEGGVFEVALQGVPSLLTLRLGRGDPRMVTLQKGLDLVVVSLLLLLGVAGLRFLREEAG